MNTALYWRRVANINSRMGDGSTQPWSFFKQFKDRETTELQWRNCYTFRRWKNLLRSWSQGSLITLSQPQLHFLVGLRATLKMFLAWRCIFTIYLTQIQHTFSNSVLNILELGIRESQDLVKDFGRTARSWKGGKAIRKKIYKFKKLKQYKEIKQNYNN